MLVSDPDRAILAATAPTASPSPQARDLKASSIVCGASPMMRRSRRSTA